MATEQATDRYALRVLDHIEPVHPHQEISTAWRWGPAWASGDARGIWVVSRINIMEGPVAIRLRADDELEALPWKEFADRLDDLRSGVLDVDARLRALDDPKAAAKPRRQSVPKVMSADLAALNDIARSELTR